MKWPRLRGDDRRGLLSERGRGDSATFAIEWEDGGGNQTVSLKPNVPADSKVKVKFSAGFINFWDNPAVRTASF